LEIDMLEKEKSDCAESLFTGLTKASRWRRKLVDQYTDPRNARAAERLNARELRLGGYGFPISDEGRGASFGLQAVQLALRAHDGRIKPTPFLLEVMERLVPDPATLVAWAEQATATEYAGLAPSVLSFAEAGDPFAEEIVAEGVRHVDVLIRSLVQFGAPRISLLGGLASRLVRWLSPEMLGFISPPESDAVAGALLLARGNYLTVPTGQRKGAQIC
jgi:glucosamine kinase